MTCVSLDERFRAASSSRPQLGNLAENALAERVSGARERIGGVRVEALELRRRPRAADPVVERCPTVHPTRSPGELAPETSLLLARARERLREVVVLAGRTAPALDSARRLDPCDRGDEMAAGHVVRRRERLALRVVRELLRHCGKAVGAADGDATERARSAPELPCDDRAIIHRRGDYGRLRALRHAGIPFTTKRRSPGLT